jgi:hypothetical protein
MPNIFTPTINYIRVDYRTNPLRFSLELVAWFMSIGCTILMGMTLPNPPFLLLYPLFIVQCLIFAWAAWTRGSTGMMMNYILISTIDIIAITRIL